MLPHSLPFPGHLLFGHEHRLVLSSQKPCKVLIIILINKSGHFGPRPQSWSVAALGFENTTITPTVQDPRPYNTLLRKKTPEGREAPVVSAGSKTPPLHRRALQERDQKRRRPGASAASLPREAGEHRSPWRNPGGPQSSEVPPPSWRPPNPQEARRRQRSRRRHRLWPARARLRPAWGHLSGLLRPRRL